MFFIFFGGGKRGVLRMGGCYLILVLERKERRRGRRGRGGGLGGEGGGRKEDEDRPVSE